MYDALKIIRFGGIITFLGLHFGGKNVFAEPAINFPISNRLLRDGLVDAKALISTTFGFDNAEAVMGAIVDGSQPIVKAVMLPNG